MERITFTQIVSREYDIDVHKKVVVATVDGEGIKKTTCEFSTITSSLTELREWLLELGITPVAMESTGVYWKPVLSYIGVDYINQKMEAKHKACLKMSWKNWAIRWIWSRLKQDSSNYNKG